MRGKLFRRVAPFVAFVAVLTQGNLGWAGKATTTTTLTKAQIVDGMSVDQNLILSQKDGYGTEGVNAFAMPATLSMNMRPGDCSNNSSGGAGPMIELSGSLTGSPVEMKLRVQTSTQSVTSAPSADYWSGSASMTLNLGNALPMAIEKRGVYSSDGTSGVGGNPYIYIRFKNSQNVFDGQQWYYLGRCVQGTDGGSLVAALQLPGRRFLRMASSQCTKEGSTVAFVHRGGPRLKGQLAFTNQKLPAGVTTLDGAQHYYEGTNTQFTAASLGITLLAGGTWSEPVRDNKWAGGNPAFGAQFKDPVTGYTNSSTLMLGRCKDLSGIDPTSQTIDWGY